MKILKFIDIKDKCPIFNDDIYYILHKREETIKVFEMLKDFKYDFDHSASVRINDDFIEASLFYKERKPKFNNIKILRKVKCPYVKDGEPRGWFKGKNDEPLRWTGISNIFYLKGEHAQEAFDYLLEALDNGQLNDKYAVQFEEDGKLIIGFCPLKKAALCC